MAPPIITTGVDKLVELVSKEKRISLKDAAKKLGVTLENIEEWVDFLEEEGLIALDHTLSATYLVPKKLTKEEAKTKTKEYKGEREAFVRKIDTTITDVEREAEEIRVLKTEFKNLHNEIGDDLSKVQDELEAIDKFREYEQRIREKKTDYEKEYSAKIDAMHRRINLLQKRMQTLLDEKKKKNVDVSQKKAEVTELIHKEEQLLNALKTFDTTLRELEKKIRLSEDSLKVDQKEVDRLNTLQEVFGKEMELSKDELQQLVAELEEKQEAITSLEKDFLGKLKQSSEIRKMKIENAKKVQSTFSDFFAKHNQLQQIMNMLDKDYAEMETELKRLAKKAIAYDITVKGGSSNYINELEGDLKTLNQKRGFFKKELEKLRALLKTRVKTK